MTESYSSKKLRFFDSMTRQVRVFESLEASRVKLYSCGPTVYNYAHIGNLRAYIFVDSLRRTLQWDGYDVLHVMNITDVGHLTDDADEGEDKMEIAASREKKTIWDIAGYYTDQFKADLSALNIQPPAVWSKATDHILEMIDWASVIEKRGYAYALDDGLYFDTSRLDAYGALGQLDLEGLEAGSRVEMVQGKRSSTDFALWRKSPTDAQRQMEWDSPWGKGAPGWHLECSCMSHKYLGMDFDIHTGGIDHRTVHHCNEIAQNQAYLGDQRKTGARWWMHNEFLVMADDAKMSKSTGNFTRLQTLIDHGVHPLAYRFFVLQASYRRPLKFSIDACKAAARGLQGFLKYITTLKEKAPDTDLSWRHHIKFSRGASFSGIKQLVVPGLSTDAQSWLTQFDAFIANDLDLGGGLAHTLAIDGLDVRPEEKLCLIALTDLVLGLELIDTQPGALAMVDDDKIRPEDIERFIQAREQARIDKDYARADEIRAQLIEQGVRLMDSPGGTTWEYII